METQGKGNGLTSDEAVREATGRSYEDWFALLDDRGMSQRGHSQIAKELTDGLGVHSWWAQTITVGYERARGLRPPHGGRDGLFAVSATKTIAVPVERLFEAFSDPALRERWLPRGGLSERTSQPGKSARYDWEGGATRVNVGFLTKGEGRSQVALSHERLPDADSAEAMKAHWRERLTALKDLLEQPSPQVLMTGISFGESPRWHEGRLWFADWGAHELIAVDTDGVSEVVARVESFPFCIDWLPDGRLLVVSAAERALLRREPDGSFARHADLSGLSEHAWNEIAGDGQGNAYVNEIGFDMAGGEFAPGTIAVVTPDGSARRVADGLAFPNGMTITPDGATLIVAESYAGVLTAFDIEADGGLSNRRVWAELGEGAAPDGICLDAEGAVWYGDVPNRHCRRVREGGELLETIELDRGCFACALGGDDGRTLFMVAREWKGMESFGEAERSGQVLVAPAPAPRAPTPLKNV